MLGDGSQDWQGIAPPESLPHAMNPEQGVVANWNNKPSADWESTEANYGPTHRSKFILDQLASLDKVSWADMEQINKEVGHMELNAYFFKNLLLSKLNTNRQELPDNVKQAAELVTNWDMYQYDQNKDGLYDHPGLTIFRGWFNQVKANILTELKGTGADTNDALFHVLVADQQELQTKYSFLGNIDLTQIVTDSLKSTVQSFNSTNPGKPINQWLTPISKISFSPLGGRSVPDILYMNRGTYNQIVEFSKSNTKSVNILPPGQSGNPYSPHFDDQRLLYANWEYKPMVLDILKQNKK
jgi:penicillin amidase